MIGNTNSGKIENSASNYAASDNDTVQGAGLLQVALCHRWTILLSTALFLFAAFIYIIKATPIFTSSSSLYVEQDEPKIIGNFEGIMSRSKNYIYTQAELIKSTPIVGEVAENPEFRRFRMFNNIDNVTAYLKNNLDVEVGKRDDIITVSLDSPYPAEAANVVNEVVDSYIRFHSVQKQTTVSKVLEILQKEKVERDKDLSEKYEEMIAFTRENGVVSFDSSGGNVVFQKLLELSEALTDAEQSALNAEADYQVVESVADDPAQVKQFAASMPNTGIVILVSDTETKLETELRDGEVELKSALYHVTEDHPAVKALHAKIEHIRGELEEERQKFASAYVAVMRRKWETAKQKEVTLQAAFEVQQKEAKGAGVKAAEYTMLMSELKRAERICEILDNRIKELNVTEDTGALNISIMEIARPAEEPSKPQKTTIMATALVLGLMFGCGLALVRDWMDVTLRSADEISAMLGIPVLGVVPTMKHAQTTSARGREALQNWQSVIFDNYSKVRKAFSAFVASDSHKGQRFAGTDTNRGKGTLQWRKDVISRGQKVHLKPRSVIAEAYRTIRTAVFFGVPKGQAKTILVTSPDAGDGKSTLVSNLAIAMAQAGQKTLILDADFRKPMQHNIFDFDNEKGLSHILAGHASIEETIRTSPVDKLDILNCGPEIPNPSELLNSDAFTEFLKNELSQRYDRIIIDSPPVGLVADSQILAAYCDITIMVLRAEKSTRRHSQQACDNLVSVGAHLLGAVVNDVPRKHGRYGYYSNYGYYRHSGYYGESEDSKSKEYAAVK
ncbi:MAG: polysaccharide biosynthesis tyrosine autokinase [Sedimentisphaerales bacterium]|nr:polysaccharide biosynthesis tyrosine autokinase [Sedimentisphaerales bacterium]